jgi:septum formation protein
MSDKLPKSLLILASASPRRAELLCAAGIDFTTRSADVDETLLPAEAPRAYVERLARAKAQAVARPGELVLGADTTAVIGAEIAGKPVDAADAARMLRMLSGQWHEVLTAVALLRDERARSAVAVTRVKFAELSEAEIAWYVASGEPFDKAGAYAIQGYAARFVEGIEGEYANVVGLPVRLVYSLLKEFNWE